MSFARTTYTRQAKQTRVFERKVKPRRLKRALINKHVFVKIEKDIYSIGKRNTNETFTKLDKKSFEFSSMDEMMITEVILDHFQTELDRIKRGIAYFKSKCHRFSEGGYYSHLYAEKTKLISKYVKCHDTHEKAKLKEKLVS